MNANMVNAMRATVGTQTESKEKKMNKSFDSMDSKEVECEILKETEKAYYVSVKYFTESGSASGKEAKMWCPKSCCAVENGRVVQIAQFVLDRWLAEYSDFIKSKGGRVPRVMFSRTEKESIENRKKADKDEYKALYDTVMEKMIADMKPIADSNLKEIGNLAKHLAGYLASGGCSAEKCDKLVEFSKTVEKEFGMFDDKRHDEYFRRNPTTEELNYMVYEFRTGNIAYGCRFRSIEGMWNPKFSVNQIRDMFLEDLRTRESRSGFYKAFKKHVMYYDRFVELASEVLNANC